MRRLITICVVTAMTSVVYALPSDSFNDNSMDTSLWNLYEDDHNNAWLDETNQRLEFRSTADANDTAALYIANDWGFLPTADFSFKVDFHYSSLPGSVLLGIRKDEESGANEVWLEAGYNVNDPCAYFCWDAIVDGNMVYGGDIGEYIKSRSLDDGTLYISYDASEDELYLSDTGYWANDAWGTIPGFVQGVWDADITACRTPNEWMVVRYVFFWPMTVAMFVQIILTIRRIIGGG